MKDNWASLCLFECTSDATRMGAILYLNTSLWPFRSSSTTNEMPTTIMMLSFHRSICISSRSYEPRCSKYCSLLLFKHGHYTAHSLSRKEERKKGSDGDQCNSNSCTLAVCHLLPALYGADQSHRWLVTNPLPELQLATKGGQSYRPSHVTLCIISMQCCVMLPAAAAAALSLCAAAVVMLCCCYYAVMCCCCAKR